MNLPRFYCPGPFAIGTTHALPDQVAHHIQVIRMRVGNAMTLFNGRGGEYAAVITRMEKRRVYAEIQTFSPREAELSYAVTLAQALPEAAKMDWIIEKAIELGVTVIQPLAAQRCVVRFNSERAEKKQSHWQGIICAAAEQSGRNRLAQLSPLSDFRHWIAQSDPHRRILLSPRGEQSLSDWTRHHSAQALSLLIGPEGGFSEAEEKLACDHGALILSMGPRVLRAETAGLCALAAINAIWGEM
ncbi:MAG TPA: 16S rRNA (uracil(1498)-N(3))-methyltransferase [Herbaspirillum sp.]|nr:16S rRNA (uracil(1498)-N(3))-methyltransferase [Herbaspirillum sp.]